MQNKIKINTDEDAILPIDDDELEQWNAEDDAEEAALLADVESPNEDRARNTPVEEVRFSGKDTKFALAQRLVGKIKEELSLLERLLTDEAEAADVEQLLKRRKTDSEAYSPVNDGRVVEGVFDGENMIGSDGNPYSVPPNYASKSKLVEGDILKLSIQPNGTFMFKQIGPIERQRVVGTLIKDEITGDWRVFALNRKFNVLAAAVSFHRGDEGDEAVILIPKEAPSKWAALENVIKK